MTQERTCFALKKSCNFQKTEGRNKQMNAVFITENSPPPKRDDTCKYDCFVQL